MKKITLRLLLLPVFLLFSFCLAAQINEDTGSDYSCSPEFTNATRTSSDLPNPVNVGTIDDRSCYSDYSEWDVYGKTWGLYNITVGSNHFGGTLQPRIERALLPTSGETGVGSYARFTGTVRILEVGDTTGSNSDGTYIAQAKGKHDTSVNPNGSPDPAICLYLAKPIYTGGVQTSFMIHAERILSRGGEGLNVGREVVPLIEVNKDEEVSFELEVGFAEDPNDPTKKIHYCNAVINGQPFDWNIPEPEIGLESKIRYGAYRVKGGRAQIRWTDTTYDHLAVPDTEGPGPSDDIYRLRNVATGEFLTAVAGGGAAVAMTSSGEAQNTHWTFEESGSASLYNIDNGTYGILRAPGTDPFEILCTSSDDTATTGDKVWTIHYNEPDDTYRFERSTIGTYLYHDSDGKVYHKNVPETDTRSVWEAIPTSQSLSISDSELQSSSIKIYPNPAEDNFTIAFQNISGVKNIEIYNILGKRVYKDSTKSDIINVAQNNNLTSGIYLVKAIANDNRVFNTKLVIK